MCNSRSSGYPLMNVTENGVHGVISLNCLMDSWVWRSLTLNFLLIFLFCIIFISLLIIVLLLRWLILLIFIFIVLSLFLILSWRGCLHGRWRLILCLCGLFGLLRTHIPNGHVPYATHEASSSSSSSRSTCSTWEPLVSSNTMSQETSTNPVDLLKTLYVLVFESYPSKKPSTALGANLDFLLF
jgi:hypothetical protein